MYDIIIIGAGPAGLTAAIYGARNNKNVLVLEGSNYGGQIINTQSIDNYPSQMGISGFDYATKIYEQAKTLGAIIKFERVESVEKSDNFVVKTKKETYTCTSLIIAVGAKNRKLGVEREDDIRGISYCATCDGAFYKGKDVAVCGGGNTAFEDALYLSDIAGKVYLIHRRDTFRAESALVDELKSKSNVEFVLNSNVVSLNGEDKLESITLDNNRVVNISGLFVAVGRTPETEIFKGLVDIDPSGYIIASEDTHTNVEGIFVCGDARTKSLRQLVTAVSDGAVAANEAIKYVNSK